MKIKTDRKRNLIIVEKYEPQSKKISRGSNFFCGCCGGVLGVSKRQLVFPFSVKEFNDSLRNKSFVSNKYGLYHRGCNHTLFPFAANYEFVSLDRYKKNVPQ